MNIETKKKERVQILRFNFIVGISGVNNWYKLNFCNSTNYYVDLVLLFVSLLFYILDKD